MEHSFGRSRSIPYFIRVCRSGSVSLGFGASVVTLAPSEFFELLRAANLAAEELEGRRPNSGRAGDGPAKSGRLSRG